MGRIFEPYDPDQPFLFLPSPKDWLPERHLSYFVSDTIGELDLKPFMAKFSDRVAVAVLPTTRGCCSRC